MQTYGVLQRSIERRLTHSWNFKERVPQYPVWAGQFRLAGPKKQDIAERFAQRAEFRNVQLNVAELFFRRAGRPPQKKSSATAP